MKTITNIIILSAIALLFSSCDKKESDLRLDGDCQILALTLDTIDGVIDTQSKTIVVSVDKSYDRSQMTVTRLDISEDATCDVSLGEQLNMLSARTIRVSNKDAVQLWQLKVEKIVEKIENPVAIYAGLADDYTSLNIEEQTACQWMLDNIPQSTYASMAQIANGDVNLKQCKLIWWHLHKDGGIDGRNAFESHAAVALEAAAKLKGFYQRGGNFFLTRYATYLPFYLGEAERFPNNCWGGNEYSAEVISDPWSFFATGHTDHPMFGDLIMDGTDPTRIYTCDAGYSITNSTAQWHIGTDWGGYADYDAWRAATGAKDLAYGGDKAIVAWEFEATPEHGAIICIGSGCYDWYSTTASAENYHRNVTIMTQNVFNHLMQ